jgi:hypothetical protein
MDLAVRLGYDRTMRTVVLAVVASLLTGSRADAAVVDYEKKEITLKIVYYGTGPLEENLQYVYAKTNPDSRGKIVELTDTSKKGEYYSFLPLRLGEIRGFKVRVDLYTVPVGQEYTAARILLLKGADGIVFVADADPKRDRASTDSLTELHKNLADLRLEKIPVVFQVAVTEHDEARVAKLEKLLSVHGRPLYEATPAVGVGVFDTLKAITKLALMELRKAESK